MSDDAEPVAIDLEDRGIEGVAQTGGAPQHGREHGLDVGRRAGDDAKNLARRCLLLLRVRKLAVPRLQELRRGLLLIYGLGQRVPGSTSRRICV